MSLLQVGVGEGAVGGIGSVNQSLGGFGCSLPVLVAFGRKLDASIKRIETFKQVSSKGFLFVCFALFSFCF